MTVPRVRRVLAAVVTHNRATLLCRCLDHLAAQSRVPDEVLVINNASTDDTEEILRSRRVRHITQENVGSAGGWNRAIEYALEQNFDAIWLMDDDGFPDEQALCELDAALVAGVACVSSVVVCEDDRERLVFPMPRLNRRGLPVLFGLARKYPTLGEAKRHSSRGLYPFAHLFNGALISMDAIRTAGNVDQAFFIYGDELDYLYRLRSVGAVYTVLAARHYHPDIGGRALTDVKVYYYIKNTLILNRRYFDWPRVRSVLTVLAALGRTASRNGWREASTYVIGARSSVLRKAVLRGLRGTPAKDFLV